MKQMTSNGFMPNRAKNWKEFKEGAKAVVSHAVSRVKTARNINRIANKDAEQSLANTKNLPAPERGFNDAMNRADRVYKESKTSLNKQIPRKFR